MRQKLPSTARGSAATNRIITFQPVRNDKIPTSAEIIVRAKSDLIPLQGSATSTLYRWPLTIPATGSAAEMIAVPSRIE
jgi:hypothetical protein